MENLVEVVFYRIFNLSTAIVIVTAGVLLIIKKIFVANLHPDEHLFRGYENADTGGESGDVSRKRQVINEIRKLREKEPLPPHYPNAWFAVMASEELKHKQVKEALFCGKEVVVWRGENGVAYVADAHCPHLGAHLGVEGEVRGNCIQCPFHHWSFDGAQAGKLTSIPYAQKVIENIHLKMWPCKEVNGFIMVWHSSDGRDPSWAPQQLEEMRGWHSLSVYNYTFYTHIEDIVENGADEQHFGPIHGNTNQKGKSFWNRLFSTEVIEFDNFTLDWLADDRPGKKHLVEMTLTCKILLLGFIYLYTSKAVLRQVGPGTLITTQNSLWGNTVVIESVTPLEPLKTRMSQKIFSSNRLKQLETLSYKNAIIQQIYKDSHIWNRKVRRMNPPLSKEDKKVQACRRWFSQFYSKSSSDSSTTDLN